MVGHAILHFASGFNGWSRRQHEVFIGLQADARKQAKRGRQHSKPSGPQQIVGAYFTEAFRYRRSSPLGKPPALDIAVIENR
jgi:hypothetical protein